MATANVTSGSGETRIAHELLDKLGIRISPRMVRKYIESGDLAEASEHVSAASRSRARAV